MHCNRERVIFDITRGFVVQNRLLGLAESGSVSYLREKERRETVCTYLAREKKEL